MKRRRLKKPYEKPKKEFKAWCNIQWRCHCRTARDYHKYGKIGIRVCRRWRRSFKAFLKDVGLAPSRLHSLDRIKVTKGYEPGNVRWATIKEQNLNRRNTIRVVWEGEEIALMYLCEKLGFNYSLAARRLARGWSIEKALTTPVKEKNANKERQKDCQNNEEALREGEGLSDFREDDSGRQAY